MNKALLTDLAWGVGIMVVALIASAARHMGYLDSDTVTRIVLGLTGLMVASFGNRLPKDFVPSARARDARRVAGWSLALSGLVYAALWAFAPIPTAVAGGCSVVILGIAVSMGYCLLLRRRARAA